MQNRVNVDSYQMEGAGLNMYEREVSSFNESILTGKPIEAPATDAVHIQKVIESIYRSVEEDKFLPL